MAQEPVASVSTHDAKNEGVSGMYAFRINGKDAYFKYKGETDKSVDEAVRKEALARLEVERESWYKRFWHFFTGELVQESLKFNDSVEAGDSVEAKEGTEAKAGASLDDLVIEYNGRTYDLTKERVDNLNEENALTLRDNNESKEKASKYGMIGFGTTGFSGLLAAVASVVLAPLTLGATLLPGLIAGAVTFALGAAGAIAYGVEYYNANKALKVPRAKDKAVETKRKVAEKQLEFDGFRTQEIDKKREELAEAKRKVVEKQLAVDVAEYDGSSAEQKTTAETELKAAKDKERELEAELKLLEGKSIALGEELKSAQNDVKVADMALRKALESTENLSTPPVENNPSTKEETK